MARLIVRGATVFVLGVISAAFPLSAQTEPPSAAAAPQSSAAIAEFQAILDGYVSLEPAPPAGRPLAETQAWRGRMMPELDRLIGGMDAYQKRQGESPDLLMLRAMCHAKRANIFLDQRRELDEEMAARRVADPQANDPELTQRQAAFAEKAAADYQSISVYLSRALELADELRQRRELRLVMGVIFAQTAIVQDRAQELSDQAGRPLNIDPGAVRRMLDESREMLVDYLAKTPTENGLEWVRGRFYLGVVEYRRSLAERVVGKEYFTAVDPARLDSFKESQKIFASLSEPDAVLQALRPQADPNSPAARAFFSSNFYRRSKYTPEAVARFYAATASLYLGLTAAIDPTLADGDPQMRLEATRKYMDQAATLDKYRPEGGESEFSLTEGTVPVSASRVVRELERATSAPQREALNDFTLSMGIAALWDTNVPLLGRNTAPPVYRDRKRDFRVPALLKFNYVADLDAFDKGNADLQKWQVFFEGRTAPTWNARIYEFNEQFYGATVNLRYELIGSDAAEWLNALYLHARYDYDYILLGNDGFLRVNRVRPMVQLLAFDQLLDASLFFNYEDRNYLEALRDERLDRDGNYFSWGLDTRWDLGKWVNAESLWGKERAWGGCGPREDDREYARPMEVQLGIEFTTNSTQGSEFDYSSQILTGGLKVPLPYGIDFSPGALFEWQDYRGNSVVDRHRAMRGDFLQEYGFRLERRFWLNQKYAQDFEHARPFHLDRAIMTIYGDIRFSFNDSNVRDRLGQSVFEYDRILYALGVRFDFN
ncbi:MAG: hypothetical protein U1D55_00650 [Phycisphaerae bacterium]